MFKKTIDISIGLSILICILFFCLGFGEMISRIIAQKKVPWEPYHIATLLANRYQPNWSGVCKVKGKYYKVNINSEGLRERELSFEKEKSVYRLLFLGDSVTYGLGVEEDATFVKIIKKLLNKERLRNVERSYSTIKKFETINAGISASFTTQEINLLNNIGLKYSPNMVILCFYLNDFAPTQYDTLLYDELKPKNNVRKTSPLRALLRKSEFYGLLCEQYYKLVDKINPLRNNPVNYVAIADRDTSWKHSKEAFYKLISYARGDWGMAWEKENYDKFRDELRKLKRFSEEKDFKLAIVCFPVAYQVNTDFIEDTPQKNLSYIAQEEKVPFLDLLPFMRAEKGDFYFDWCHLTAEGHKFVAEKIYNFLKEITSGIFNEPKS